MSDLEVPQDSGEGPVPDVPPASPPPGREEDLLGLRIAAALIDLAVLAGLFIILSATVGQANVSGGSFNVYLSGTWLVVFLAIALLYYFVLEAWAGQTLGKRLLGPAGSRRAGGTAVGVGGHVAHTAAGGRLAAPAVPGRLHHHAGHGHPPAADRRSRRPHRRGAGIADAASRPRARAAGLVLRRWAWTRARPDQPHIQQVNHQAATE